ncbi:hypothetical protein [Pseudoduganella violacea]|uniref:DUF2489 domain-containing protein n=1 Tax=Pseudoduganella violacea TaxID=1715466 RepID=A0A7W5BG09_9BURK|nr:hypothetical protein [Pseudoduganella violacea]MBB3122477.1 hypothetical protein [Pseudoduganella violacea]
MMDVLSFAIWSGIAIALGAIVAAWLTRRTKISEFRQEWINELRADIAAYIGAADRWMTARNELNEAPHTERQQMAPNAEKLSNEARVILHRIELRINPRKNKFEDADKEFLSSLWKLLDPSALPGTSWRALADNSVRLGRELLKREWEVAKNVFF